MNAVVLQLPEKVQRQAKRRMNRTELDAELIEIDENLCRSELTAAQRSSAIRRRKEIWTALHPEESGRNSPTLGGRGNTSFASETAEVSGESKRRINEHLARAEALSDDLDEVVGTSLDKGVELDALGKYNPAEVAAWTPEQRRAAIASLPEVRS